MRGTYKSDGPYGGGGYGRGGMDNSELDPCIAAEARMKKSVMSSRTKRLLLLALLLLLLLLVLGVVLVLLLSPETDPSHVDYDTHKQPPKMTSLDYDSGDEAEQQQQQQPLMQQAAETKPTRPPSTRRRPPPVRVTSGTKRPVPAVRTTATSTTTTTTSVPVTTTTTEYVLHVQVEPMTTLASSSDRPIYKLLSDDIKKECSDFIVDGLGDGIYNVSPDGGEPIQVLCLFDSEGRAWAVMHERFDGRTPFYNHTMAEYAKGFGRIDGEHWLGLDNMHRLAGEWRVLRIELHGDFCDIDVHGSKCNGQPDGFWWGEWRFQLSGASDIYRLGLSTMLRGNLTLKGKDDRFFMLNNGQRFTTLESDNDNFQGGSCAQFKNFGGWWHKDCTYTSLNGMYGDTSFKYRYQMWFLERENSSTKFHLHPKRSRMMVRAVEAGDE